MSCVIRHIDRDIGDGGAVDALLRCHSVRIGNEVSTDLDRHVVHMQLRQCLRGLQAELEHPTPTRTANIKVNRCLRIGPAGQRDRCR